jgi:hypothetical protein
MPFHLTPHEIIDALCHRLCRRHTVPKLTPDGHTNMESWISREDDLELGQQPINSRSKYDAYRRSHDGTRTTHEDNTKMCICIVVYTRRTHEGHTMATRRRIESPSKTPEKSPEGCRSPQWSERSPQQSRRSREDALRLAFYMSTLPWHMGNAWATLRRHRGPNSMSSYYNTMATRRHCEGFT